MKKNLLKAIVLLVLAIVNFSCVDDDANNQTNDQKSERVNYFEQTEINDFSQLREQYVISKEDAKVVNPDNLPVQLERFDISTSKGVEQAVSFYEQLDKAMQEICSNENIADGRDIFNTQIQNYLNTLLDLKNGVSQDASDVEKLYGVYIGQFNQKQWGLFWYRTVTSKAFHGCKYLSVVNGYDWDLPDIVRSNYGALYVKGLDNPQVCIKKAKEQTLKQGTFEWGATIDWVYNEYSQMLDYKSKDVKTKAGEKAYYRFLGKYFLFDNQSTDYALTVLGDVRDSEKLSKKEKNNFFKAAKIHLAEINKSRKKMGLVPIEFPIL